MCYIKRKGEEKIPSLTLIHISDIQIFQCQCIIVSEKVFPDEPQAECLVIAVFISFGTEILVTVAGHVLLEEASQVFQIFLLVSFEVTAHDDDAPVGDAANAATVFPETDL